MRTIHHRLLFRRSGWLGSKASWWPRELLLKRTAGPTGRSLQIRVQDAIVNVQQLVHFQDDVVGSFLRGGSGVPEALREWLFAYDGSGRGEARDDATRLRNSQRVRHRIRHFERLHDFR